MEIANLVAKYSADTADFDRGAARVNRSFEHTAKSAGSASRAVSGFAATTRSSGRGLADVFGGNVAANAIGKLTGLLTSGGVAVFEYSARLQQTKIGFETLMGGAAAAEGHLKELQKFAESTPFAFEDLAKASRRFQNVGLEASKVIPVMRDIGNAAAAAGASSSELDSITLAFSQIIAKGKLSAEEVNQLAERGIPVWRMLEDQLGKSKGEIIKLAEQGKISSEVFLQAFQKFSQAKFGDAMVKQSKTFSGAWSTIADTILAQSTDFMKPLFDEVSNFSVKFASALTSEQTTTKGVVANFFYSLGQTAGESFRAGQSNINQVIVDFLTTAVKETVAGFTAGPKQLSVADLRKMDDAIGGFAPKIDKIKSLAVALDSDKAAKQTKVLRDVIRDVIDDLTSRIAFFGQESEVASVKQNLLSQGVTNFSSAAAKSAVGLAAQLDKMIEAKKVADAYGTSLKSAKDELARTKADADFQIRFPQANELDRFREWVRTSASNFRELKVEIGLTEQKLKNLLTFQASDKRSLAIDSFNESIRELVRSSRDFDSDSFSGQFQKTVKSSLDAFNLSGAELDKIAEFAETAIKAYHDKLNADAAAFKMTNVTPMLEGFQQALQQFKVDGLQIFPDDVGNFEKLLEVWDAVEKSTANAKLREFKETLGGLGIGEVTPLDQLLKSFADPTLSAGIDKIAASLGFTIEKLKSMALHTFSTEGIAESNVVREIASGWQEVATIKERISKFSNFQALEIEKAQLQEIVDLRSAETQKIIDANFSFRDRLLFKQ